MRPFEKLAVANVSEITSRFPRVHGAPVHVGDRAVLGIIVIGAPDLVKYLRYFLGRSRCTACGLTATVALQQSGIDFFITPAPAKMPVTDCLNASLETDMSLRETK